MAVLNLYPLDPTGTNVNNLVRGEAAVIPPTGMRVIALKYGAFYADSLVIKDVATNTLLTKAQYHATWRYKVPTSQFKKDICGLIIITDASVGNQVLVDYQVVGGIYSGSEEAIVALINRRLGQNRPAAWSEILAKPPALTLKDFTDDDFGFARVENVLNEVARTMVNGHPETQDALYDYTDAAVDPNVGAVSQAFATALAVHTNRADAHPMYLLKSQAAGVMPKVFAPVRRPKNTLPTNKREGVAIKPTLEASVYRALYGIPQAKMQVQISTRLDFSQLTLDTVVNGVVTKYTATANLAVRTKYYWRVRYQNTEAEWSEWSYPTSFTTA